MSLLAATAGCIAAALFMGVFMTPHAFGGRDGQGGAAIAALFIVAGAAVALVAVPLAIFLGHRLKAHPAFFWLAVALPVSAAAAAMLYGRFA